MKSAKDWSLGEDFSSASKIALYIAFLSNYDPSLTITVISKSEPSADAKPEDPDP